MELLAPSPSVTRSWTPFPLQTDVELLALSPRMTERSELQHLSPTPPSQEERALGSPLFVILGVVSSGVSPFSVILRGMSAGISPSLTSL